MTDTPLAPLSTETKRCIVITVGWRKLIMPFSNANMMLAAQFIAATDGIVYDDQWVQDEKVKQIGGLSTRHYPQGEIELIVRETTISNRPIDEADFTPATDEDQPALAVAAE